MIKKGKYAGECKSCGLVLMEGEEQCVKCGAKFKPASPKTLVVKEAECDCDCDPDSICKCGQRI